MSNVEVDRSIEAILMVVDEPVTELTVATLLDVPVDLPKQSPERHPAS